MRRVQVFLTKQLGAFPDLNNPRLIYLPAKEVDGNRLGRLQKEIGDDLKQIGIKVEARPWTPHLTLARVKNPIIFQPANFTCPEQKIAVTSIELMESQLKPSGPEYGVLTSYSLKN